MSEDIIPNPLEDKTIKQDIQDYIEKRKQRRVSIGTLAENQDKLLKDVAYWCYANGFRCGWRVHETRSKR